MPPEKINSVAAFPVTFRPGRYAGLTGNQVVRGFFGGNAIVSVVVLGLITLFLLREGHGFFGQNRRNLEIYRAAGLEFVDILKRQEEGFGSLNRTLFEIRLAAGREKEPGSPMATEAELEAFDAYTSELGDAASPLRELVGELVETASAIKTKLVMNEDRLAERQHLLAAGRQSEAGSIRIETIDSEAELRPLLESLVYCCTNG